MDNPQIAQITQMTEVLRVMLCSPTPWRSKSAKSA